MSSTIALPRAQEGIAPSHALRRWFHEAPEARWAAFQDRWWRQPLHLRGLAEYEAVTLLFAARNEACNSAVVLKSVLDEGLV